MFRLIPMMMVLATCVASSQNGCVQLLQNGGCEAGLFGWTTTVGSFSPGIVQNPSTQPGPRSGSFFFFADVNSMSVLEQVVSVASYATTIAAGVQRFELRGYVASALQFPSDTSCVDLEFLNAAGLVLSSSTTGAVASPMTWTAVGFVQLAPPTTTDIRVRFTSVRNNGANNDGYYDDFALVALPVAGNGQANSPQATLDVNNTAGTGPGPFYVSVLVGGTLTLDWSGTPFNAWYLLLGIISPADQNLGCLGLLDLAGPAIFAAGSLNGVGTDSLLLGTNSAPPGFQFGLQGFVLDPSPCGGTLTAAYCVATF